MAELFRKKCKEHGDQLVVAERSMGATTHSTLACGCTVETVEQQDIAIGEVVFYQDELYRVEDTTDDGGLLLRNVYRAALAKIELCIRVGPDTLTGMQVDQYLEVGATVRHVTRRLTGKVFSSAPNNGWKVRTSDGQTYVWDDHELEILRPPPKESRYFSGVPAKPPKKKSSGGAIRRDRNGGRYVDYGPSTSSPSPKKKVKREPKAPAISTADLIKEEIHELEKDQLALPKVSPKKAPRKQVIDTPEEPIGPIPKRSGSW